MKNSFFSILLMLVAGSAVNAQSSTSEPRYALGVGAGATASGNGYGMRYAAFVYYKLDKNVFRLGALMQKSRSNISGFDLRYERILIKRDSAHNAELFTFLSGTYNSQAYLCFREQQMESVANVEDRINPENYSFRSVELFGGFGLNWHMTKRLQWINIVGLGVYHTLNFPGRMYYGGNGAGLILRSELAVRLNP